MFVCICNALKQDTLEALAEEGMSFDEIQSVTGCAGNCGSCREDAESLISSVRSRHQGSRHIPVLTVA
jgi:bacterioferritin-associated ferredoxin